VSEWSAELERHTQAFVKHAGEWGEGRPLSFDQGHCDRTENRCEVQAGRRTGLRAGQGVEQCADLPSAMAGIETAAVVRLGVSQGIARIVSWPHMLASWL
jgi:hypothetical protein